MIIPTEPIGSIPRTPELRAAISGQAPDGAGLDALYEAAVRDTVERFEATGSPVITDGERRKHHNFLTYCVHGAPNTWPEGIPGYPREQFIDDLLGEHETEVRRCLERSAYQVQIDFTEGRLAMKLDPGGDLDSTHRADVDHADLLPSLFELHVGSFCIALAREPDPERVLKMIARHAKPGQMVFVGVTDVNDPHIETADQVRDRVLQAARHIPLDQLGTTDDCGYAPFCDDQSTTRETAFAKIRARVDGTALARAILKDRA